MTIDAVLSRVCEMLRAAGIPFMLTGSVASAVHGHGRATMDIDLVIDPTASQLDRFVDAVASSGAYVSADAAREALAHRTMFNVVDPESGWKVDLILRKTRAFSEAEFERRVEADLLGQQIDVATLEDVILSKLEWAKLGGSARQLEDVRALLALHRDSIDSAYMNQWIRALGLHAQWQAVNAQEST